MKEIEDRYCLICGKTAQELHHIIYKSQCIPLKDCKLNHVYLCSYHHRNQRVGVHFNKELDRKIKLRFQNELELLFLKNEFIREEVGQALQINNKATDKLCKLIKQHNGMFARDEIITACMGGQRVQESEVNDEKSTVNY